MSGSSGSSGSVIFGFLAVGFEALNLRLDHSQSCNENLNKSRMVYSGLMKNPKWRDGVEGSSGNVSMGGTGR